MEYQLILRDKERCVPFLQKIVSYQMKYYFSDIEDINFKDDGSIEIFSSVNLNKEKISNALDKIIKRFGRINSNYGKIIYNSQSHDEYISKILPLNEKNIKVFIDEANILIGNLRQLDADVLMEQDGIIPVRKGINIYSQSSLMLIELLDNFIKSYFKKVYNIRELYVPSMISSEIVDKAGYFETGCQHISFVSPITNDLEKFDDFLPYWRKQKSSVKNKKTSIYKYLKSPKDVLNPALCLHCYPLHENEVIDDNKTIVYTVRGSCFRDESGNLNNKERLNEFLMREVVFLANEKNMKSIHTEVLNFMFLIGILLGYEFKLETSNDIFFNDNAERQLFSQIVSDNKIELAVYSKTADKYIATCSLNKHLNHFSKTFNISSDIGNYITTMCVGFGYNRMILVLLENLQKGLKEFISNMQANIDIINKFTS